MKIEYIVVLIFAVTVNTGAETLTPSSKEVDKHEIELGKFDKLRRQLNGDQADMSPQDKTKQVTKPMTADTKSYLPPKLAYYGDDIQNTGPKYPRRKNEKAPHLSRTVWKIPVYVGNDTKPKYWRYYINGTDDGTVTISENTTIQDHPHYGPPALYAPPPGGPPPNENEYGPAGVRQQQFHYGPPQLVQGAGPIPAQALVSSGFNFPNYGPPVEPFEGNPLPYFSDKSYKEDESPPEVYNNMHNQGGANQPILGLPPPGAGQISFGAGILPNIPPDSLPQKRHFIQGPPGPIPQQGHVAQGQRRQSIYNGPHPEYAESLQSALPVGSVRQPLPPLEYGKGLGYNPGSIPGPDTNHNPGINPSPGPGYNLGPVPPGSLPRPGPGYGPPPAGGPFPSYGPGPGDAYSPHPAQGPDSGYGPVTSYNLESGYGARLPNDRSHGHPPAPYQARVFGNRNRGYNDRRYNDRYRSYSNRESNDRDSRNRGNYNGSYKGGFSSRYGNRARAVSNDDRRYRTYDQRKEPKIISDERDYDRESRYPERNGYRLRGREYNDNLGGASRPQEARFGATAPIRTYGGPEREQGIALYRNPPGSDYGKPDEFALFGGPPGPGGQLYGRDPQRTDPGYGAGPPPGFGMPGIFFDAPGYGGGPGGSGIPGAGQGPHGARIQGQYPGAPIDYGPQGPIMGPYSGNPFFQGGFGGGRGGPFQDAGDSYEKLMESNLAVINQGAVASRKGSDGEDEGADLQPIFSDNDNDLVTEAPPPPEPPQPAIPQNNQQAPQDAQSGQRDPSEERSYNDESEYRGEYTRPPSNSYYKNSESDYKPQNSYVGKQNDYYQENSRPERRYPPSRGSQRYSGPPEPGYYTSDNDYTGEHPDARKYERGPKRPQYEHKGAQRYDDSPRPYHDHKRMSYKSPNYDNNHDHRHDADNRQRYTNLDYEQPYDTSNKDHGQAFYDNSPGKEYDHKIHDYSSQDNRFKSYSDAPTVHRKNYDSDGKNDYRYHHEQESDYYPSKNVGYSSSDRSIERQYDDGSSFFDESDHFKREDRRPGYKRYNKAPAEYDRYFTDRDEYSDRKGSREYHTRNSSESPSPYGQRREGSPVVSEKRRMIKQRPSGKSTVEVETKKMQYQQYTKDQDESSYHDGFKFQRS